MRKFVTLVLILVLISVSPTSASLASNNVKIEELSTATACQVSLLSIWQVYGVPYPCFVKGTQLSIAAPNKTNLDSHLLIKVNSDIRNIAWDSIVGISNYTLGLNSVEFGVNDENKNFVQIGQQFKFIVYSSPKRFFSDQRVSTATPYVVVMRDDANVSSIALEVGISNQSYMTSSVSGGKTQSFANSSIFVMDLDPSQLILMQGNSNVEAIARQQIHYLSDVQANPPSWGLDRINQPTLPLDSSYDYKRTGKGVKVYVVDSGINNTHSDFTGRIGQGAYRTTLGSTEDCTGHGTHVSGTVAGSSYGVAKEATIIPVRVFGCTGDATLSDVIGAFQWVIENHADADPAVVNISIGGEKSSLVNDYIQEMINDGLVVVVAAGNDFDLACDYSPASAPNAITVAASTTIDTDATYSNIGSCVDIFAPGSSITSAWIGSSSASNTIDGTSMASPHVAGAAALVLEKDFTGYVNKLDANSLVRDALLNNATNNALSASDGLNWWPNTTNTLLNTSFITGRDLTPAFSTSNQTGDGFTLQISNYDARYAWAGTNSSAGAVVISPSGLITVTGIAPGVSSTVTITTTRTGYSSGSATSSSMFSLLTGLTPAFSTSIQTDDGYTLQISNYDTSFAWAGTNSSAGAVAISPSGLITVTGASNRTPTTMTSSTVTITTTRTGYLSGSATSPPLFALFPGVTPAFSTSIQTGGGFTLQISNYDASFAWAGTNSLAGAVVISSSGLITVTGVAPGVSSTVTITTTRTGYLSGSATSSSLSAVASIHAVKVGQVAAKSKLLELAKLKAPTGSKYALSVKASSKKICKVLGTTIKTLKKGTCVVNVTVTLKGKKPTPKTIEIKVG